MQICAEYLGYDYVQVCPIVWKGKRRLFLLMSKKERIIKEFIDGDTAVSYTHLDVYKRQACNSVRSFIGTGRPLLLNINNEVSPVLCLDIMKRSSIAGVKVGDVIYPVTLEDGMLFVMARLPVGWSQGKRSFLTEFI